MATERDKPLSARMAQTLPPGLKQAWEEHAARGGVVRGLWAASRSAANAMRENPSMVSVTCWVHAEAPGEVALVRLERAASGSGLDCVELGVLPRGEH